MDPGKPYMPFTNTNGNRSIYSHIAYKPMLAYTYISPGKFELIDKPKPEFYNDGVC